MPVLDSTERAVPRSALRHRPIRADADEQEERSSASGWSWSALGGWGVFSSAFVPAASASGKKNCLVQTRNCA